jgi:hypothetical protein
MATSCGKLLGSLFRRFPIATGYELAHMLAASDETAREEGNAIGPSTSVSRPSSRVIVLIQLSNSERVCVRVLEAGPEDVEIIDYH